MNSVAVEFCAAVQTLVEAQAATLRRYEDEWRTVAALFRADPLCCSDDLYSCFPPHRLPTDLRSFLDRCHANPQPANPAGLTSTEVNNLWSDCLAVAYHRLYTLLVALPGIGQPVPAWPALTPETAARLAAALELVSSLERTPEGERMSARLRWEPSGLGRVFAGSELARSRDRVAAWYGSEENSELLAALALLVGEERGRTVQPVWVPVAGVRGGMVQIEVAALAAANAAPVEIAPWSRHRPTTRGLARIAAPLAELIGVPVTSYRVAANPAGIFPAGAAHLRQSSFSGESIDLALALAAYAASRNAALGRYAVTGVVSGELDIIAVDEVADKLRKVHQYNREVGDRRLAIVDVLVPDANLAAVPAVPEDAPTLVALEGEPHLRINRTLRGPTPVFLLRHLLEPGFLSDGLAPYVEIMAAMAATEGADFALARELADPLVDLLANGDANRAHIIPAPFGYPPEQLARYLAARLAARRRDWGRSLGSATLAAKPPAPLLLGAPSPGQDLAQLAASAIVQITNRPDLTAYTYGSWRAMPGEYALLLFGGDELVRRSMLPAGGVLDGIDGHGAAGGRHHVVLIARSVEQMQRWLADLQTQGEL